MHPFTIEIPDSQLEDLRRRIAATRWPAEQPGSGWQRGVPLDYLKDLADYWLSSYDWRRAERALNGHAQFTTVIDGVRIHFLHVRSPEPGARPLLLTHGWPSSIVEFLDVIGPLTDPRSHGGDPADAFDVVIPSLPGHGFSAAPSVPGWDIRRVAGAFATLMRELGYESYLAAGGDWGSLVSLELGHQDPEHVRGAHLAMLVTVPSGDPAEMSALSTADLARLDKLSRYDAELSGYMKLQTTRPMTVSYGLTDSPVGQLAWIMEKFFEWTGARDVPEDVIDRDTLLTNATIYWLTGTAGSSAQLYYESAAYLAEMFTPGKNVAPVTVPLGVAAFDADAAPPVRTLAERAYPTIIHWTEFAEGGHFGALEQPASYVADIRTFSRSVAAGQGTVAPH